MDAAATETIAKAPDPTSRRKGNDPPVIVI